MFGLPFLARLTDALFLLQVPVVEAPANSELLDWVNSNLPASTTKASDLSTSLRSGEVLVRLVENLSGTKSSIDDASFAKYRPGQKEHVDTYFDVVFNVFDFLTPLVSSAFLPLSPLQP